MKNPYQLHNPTSEPLQTSSDELVGEKSPLTIQLIELLVLLVLVAVCSAFWYRSQNSGWIATNVCVSFAVCWLNRCKLAMQLPSSMFELPMVMLSLFTFALFAGLRHPPFMVPEGWKWPPFSSVAERVAHAFALSLWALFWGCVTILACDLAMYVASCCRQSVFSHHREIAKRGADGSSPGLFDKERADVRE